MKIPAYLVAAKVADAPIDYKWDPRIHNRFLAADADSKPALAKALGAISGKAAFAFAVASAEWVVARVAKHVDTTDALLRVEAAWAGTVDPRYAKLPPPEKLAATANATTDRPLYLAMLLLSVAHERYVKGQIDGVYIGALALGMLAEHVAGRNAVFKKWVPAVLKRAQVENPRTTQPLAKEAPVARELLTLEGAEQGAAAAESRAKLLASLNPADNRYLRSAAELIAERVSQNPYPGKS